MRVYTDVSGSVEFTGSYLALSTVQTAWDGPYMFGQDYEVVFEYSTGSGISNIQYCNFCATPTPTPEPTPVPTPVPTPGPTPVPTVPPTAPPPTTVNYPQQISNARSNNLNGCTWSFTGTKYTAVDYNNLTVGTKVYNDAGLTSVFNGGGQWYRFGQSTATGQSYLVTINSSGQLNGFFNC